MSNVTLQGNIFGDTTKQQFKLAKKCNLSLIHLITLSYPIFWGTLTPSVTTCIMIKYCLYYMNTAFRDLNMQVRNSFLFQKKNFQFQSYATILCLFQGLLYIVKYLKYSLKLNIFKHYIVCAIFRAFKLCLDIKLKCLNHSIIC